MRSRTHEDCSAAAFTRLELAVTLAAFSFLCLLAVPLLAGTRTDSQRAGCFNNLRRIGSAINRWSNNHNDVVPWETFVSQGGTRPDSGFKTAAAWTEFIVLTNDLASPSVFACPSDGATKVASHWGNTANGLANTGFRGNALSYFLNFHAETELGRSVITGDRDFHPSSPGPVGCARGANNAASVSRGDFSVQWTNANHVASGNVLFADGAVEYCSDSRLRAVLTGTEVQNDSSSIHFINAR
jgi:prepilin-type processing-associated H-X9-DG protein